MADETAGGEVCFGLSICCGFRFLIDLLEEIKFLGGVLREAGFVFRHGGNLRRLTCIVNNYYLRNSSRFASSLNANQARPRTTPSTGHIHAVSSRKVDGPSAIETAWAAASVGGADIVLFPREVLALEQPDGQGSQAGDPDDQGDQRQRPVDVRRHPHLRRRQGRLQKVGLQHREAQ
jgi:hypothetical protein